MKLLIEIPTWLGDTIMAIPSLKIIIENNKDDELIFIGNHTSLDVIKNTFKSIKTIELKKNYLSLLNFAFKNRGFDIFISYRRSVRSLFFNNIIRSKKKYIYNRREFDSSHQVEKYCKFISFIFQNVPYKKPEIEFLSPEYIFHQKADPYLVLNPGASYGEAKCWPPEYFAELAWKLSTYLDIVIVGSKNNKDTSLKITSFLDKKKITNYYDYTGRTSIEELFSIVKNAELLITGDSGTMHIAAAYKKNSISIFGPTDSTDTSQWKNPNDNILKKHLDCQPCLARTCKLKHHNCMKLIKPNEVMELALRIYDEK